MALGLQRLSRKGAAGGSWQYFNPAPGKPSPAQHLEAQQLTRAQGRERIARAFQSGFRGVAAFAVLEDDRTPRLWIEVYDTDTGQSVGGAVTLKRRPFGRFAAAGSNFEVEHIPTIPGIFENGAPLSRADAARREPAGEAKAEPLSSVAREAPDAQYGGRRPAESGERSPNLGPRQSPEPLSGATIREPRTPTAVSGITEDAEGRPGDETSSEPMLTRRRLSRPGRISTMVIAASCAAAIAAVLIVVGVRSTHVRRHSPRTFAPRIVSVPTGEGGALWDEWFSQGRWHGPANIRSAGQLGSSAATAVHSDSQQDVFWRGPDGRLRETFYYGGWHKTLEFDSTTLASAPAAGIDDAGTEHVVWRGIDNRLWSIRYAAGRWSAPLPVPAVSHLAGAPAVAVGRNGDADVFWRGSDGNLWEVIDHDGWQRPLNLGGRPLGSDPAAGTDAGGNVYVFWRGTAGNLWDRWSTDGQWHGPALIAAAGRNMSSAPTVAVHRNSEQDVFWRGTDGDLWESYYLDGWHPAVDLGAGPLGSAPTAAVDGAGNQYVFWRGIGGAKLPASVVTLTPSAPPSEGSSSIETPTWRSIIGTEVSNNGAVLVTQDSSTGASAYHIYGLTTSTDTTLDPAAALPAGVTINSDPSDGNPMESAAVSPASPGHPDGVFMVLLSATKEANGLTAPASAWYLVQYDVASQHELSSTKVSIPAGWSEPTVFGYSDGSLDVGDGQYPLSVAHLSDGAFSASVSVPHPPSDADGYATSSDGLALVMANADVNNSCGKAWVLNARTVKVQAETPGCHSWAENSSTDGTFVNDHAFGMSRVDGLWSSTTGQELSSAPHSAESEEDYVTGPRSDIVVAWDDSGEQPTYVLSSLTGKILLTSPATDNGPFKAFGVADDDVWAEKYGNSFVFNGKSGAKVSGSFSVYPVDGGNGWTLCEVVSDGTGPSQAYLYRGPGPLVAHFMGVPRADGANAAATSTHGSSP